MLPELDGLEVCRRIRKELDLPIIMLTAREKISTGAGVRAGADDYLTKPFNPRELVARIKAILRRSAPREEGLQQVIRVGELQIDLLQHRVHLRQKNIDLTSKEFTLLVI